MNWNTEIRCRSCGWRGKLGKTRGQINEIDKVDEYRCPKNGCHELLASIDSNKRQSTLPFPQTKNAEIL